MKTKPKLLVICDNTEDFAFLIDFGYSLTFLPLGQEALDYLKTHDVTFDLIVMEVLLSFTRGWAILNFLRNNEPFNYLPIVFISDLKEKTDQLLALRSGADDFIEKPFDVDLFLVRLEVALRRAGWNRVEYVNLKDLPFVRMPRDLVELTKREKTILKQLSKGESNDEIADKLHLSKLTVKTHIKNIFKKLKVNNRTEAILVGYKFGLINN